MVWARLDDAILDNPKIIQAGPLAFMLHVAAISWCARNLTDGYLSREQVPRLLCMSRVSHAVTNALNIQKQAKNFNESSFIDAIVDELVAVRLWDRCDDGRFRLHDFLKYNLSREQVEKTRKKAAERQSKHRSTASQSRRDFDVTHVPVTRAPEPEPVKIQPPLIPLAGDTQKKEPKRATGCPSSDEPTADAWCVERKIPKPSIEPEVIRFLDHHSAKGNVFKNWTSAWRLWRSNALKWASERPQSLFSKSGPKNVQPAAPADAAWRHKQKPEDDEDDFDDVGGLKF